MIDVVVKLGGGLLAHQADFQRVVATINEAALAGRRMLIVPGGGPFADTVRRVYDAMDLSEDSAHWMAVLAMDQHAHLIASRLQASTIVRTPADIDALADARSIPVLAPSQWLQQVDPLPHDWTVTSDSIAAWIAGALGAGHLVLIKPPRAAGESLVDPYFTRALQPHVSFTIVTADQIDVLASTLADGKSLDPMRADRSA